jgi:hypothetical protein
MYVIMTIINVIVNVNELFKLVLTSFLLPSYPLCSSTNLSLWCNQLFWD